MNDKEWLEIQGLKDEIERLRAEVADWQRTVRAQESVAETLRAVVAEKHAEIERLRAMTASRWGESSVPR